MSALIILSSLVLIIPHDIGAIVIIIPVLQRLAKGNQYPIIHHTYVMELNICMYYSKKPSKYRAFHILSSISSDIILILTLSAMARISFF